MNDREFVKSMRSYADREKSVDIDSFKVNQPYLVWTKDLGNPRSREVGEIGTVGEREYKSRIQFTLDPRPRIVEKKERGYSVLNIDNRSGSAFAFA